MLVFKRVNIFYCILSHEQYKWYSVHGAIEVNLKQSFIPYPPDERIIRPFRKDVHRLRGGLRYVFRDKFKVANSVMKFYGWLH